MEKTADTVVTTQLLLRKDTVSALDFFGFAVMNYTSLKWKVGRNKQIPCTVKKGKRTLRTN